MLIIYDHNMLLIIQSTGPRPCWDGQTFKTYGLYYKCFAIIMSDTCTINVL
jgi:hypothetical protein